MPEQVITQTQQTQTVEPVKTEPVVTPTPKVTEDLITRASKVKIESTEPVITEPDFDLNEIEKIQDPQAKDYAMKAYKSLQRGFNDKYQQLAELRKSYEAKLGESEWTKDKVKQVTQDPKFLKAAQEVMQEQNPPDSGITDTEWSAMTQKEKQQLFAMRSEINQLKLQNQQQAILQEYHKQDEQLKTKYANYNPQAVDILTADLLNNKVQATREHLFKAVDYDDAVKRAYQLGKQDSQLEKQEKLGASSFEGLSTTQPSKEIPVAEKNESTQSYFGKLVANNIQKMKVQR